MSSNLYNMYGININNEEMFFYKLASSKIDSKMTAIRVYTSNNYLLQLLWRLKGFKLVKLDDKELKLSYKNDIINFSRFSDLVYCDDINELKLLRSGLLNRKSRRGKCHNKSLEFIYFGHYLVTGYVDDSIKNRRIVHTWLETDKNVIDYTANLVIKKEDYYKLMNAEIFSIINQNDVLNDFNSEFFREFVGCKFYSLFREELFREGLIQFEQDNQFVKKK